MRLEVSFDRLFIDRSFTEFYGPGFVCGTGVSAAVAPDGPVFYVKKASAAVFLEACSYYFYSKCTGACCRAGVFWQRRQDADLCRAGAGVGRLPVGFVSRLADLSPAAMAFF